MSRHDSRQISYVEAGVLTRNWAWKATNVTVFMHPEESSIWNEKMRRRHD